MKLGLISLKLAEAGFSCLFMLVSRCTSWWRWFSFEAKVYLVGTIQLAANVATTPSGKCIHWKPFKSSCAFWPFLYKYHYVPFYSFISAVFYLLSLY